jgi:hypothetical protein
VLYEGAEVCYFYIFILRLFEFFLEFFKVDFAQVPGLTRLRDAELRIAGFGRDARVNDKALVEQVNWPTEFLDQCKNQSFVLAEEVSHLCAVFRLSRLRFCHRASGKKVSVNLPVKVFPVRHDHKSEVTRFLSEYLADVEDH